MPDIASNSIGELSNSSIISQAFSGDEMYWVELLGSRPTARPVSLDIGDRLQPLRSLSSVVAIARRRYLPCAHEPLSWDTGDRLQCYASPVGTVTGSIDTSIYHLFVAYAAKSRYIPSARHMERAFARLSELARLEHNWDTYGAVPIASTAVQQARQFLLGVNDRLVQLRKSLVAPHTVVPLSNGGIQLEWRSGCGLLEIEIGPRGQMGYLKVEDSLDGRHYRESDSITAREAEDLVADVLNA